MIILLFQRPDSADEEVPENEASPAHESAESEEDEEKVSPTKAKQQDVNYSHLLPAAKAIGLFQDDESESGEISWDQSDEESTDSSIDVDEPNEELYKKFLK